MNRIVDATEWQAQERALHEERNHAAPSDDPLHAHYRQVARALRTTPDAGPPPSFAAQVAALARADALHAGARHAPADLRLEQRLLRALVLVLALVAAVLVAAQGPRWLHALNALLPGIAGSWMLATLACIGMSWSVGLLSRGSSAQR